MSFCDILLFPVVLLVIIYFHECWVEWKNERRKK
jgi:hypothetical protein